MNSKEYQEYERNRKKPKENKYHAVRKQVGDKNFDSTGEGDYYIKLLFAQKLPKNDPDYPLKIERQIVFELVVDGVLITTYRLDFRVTYANRVEHIDWKGCREGLVYDMFLIKKRLMWVCHGIEVIEKGNFKVKPKKKKGEKR